MSATEDQEKISEYIHQIGILKRPRGNLGGKSKFRYKDAVCAFDTETTRLRDVEQAIMYIWQMQIEDITVYGRTWDEFLHLLEIMKEGMKEKERYLIFVHNLAFDFVGLSGIYDFQPEEVFILEGRRVLKCEMFGHFEFRCSYIQTNMSLDEFTHKYGVESAKLHDFDYTKTRYPWTPLSADELQYCLNDVKGLVQALKLEMQTDGDNLYTIPLTSTGNVRRQVKKAMKTYNWDTLHRQLPSFEIYNMLYAAFRGGNTHAARLYAGDIIGDPDGDYPYKVYSFDRSSSYPDVICNDRFPVGRWYIESPEDTNLERMLYLMEKRNKAILMTVQFLDIRLKSPTIQFPYIPYSKCSAFVEDKQRRNYDNGRVLAAEFLEMTITDVDMDIILDQYEFSHMHIVKLATSTYGKLPGQLTDKVIEYYTRKTELKGNAEQRIYYDKNKALLNSIYGMMVQRQVKIGTVYDHGNYIPDLSKTPEELFEKSMKNAFLNYAWGIWVCAHARKRLQEGIDLVENTPGCYALYCDTDSVKFMCEDDAAFQQVNKEWKKYNLKRQQASRRSGAYARDSKGKAHYMGVFEYEGEYERFSTLGAKKYCYVEGGELHITIAGVNKKEGAKELNKHGGITAFKEGFLFRDAGGIEAVYNDFPDITEYHAEGHTLKITRNVVLRESTYLLGIAGEYKRLLENPEIYMRIFDDRTSLSQNTY